MSIPEIRRVDGDRRHNLTPEQVTRRAALAVADRSTDAADLCDLLHALDITEVNGRKVLNAPKTNALPRRSDGSGRLSPHAHRAAKTDDAAR